MASSRKEFTPYLFRYSAEVVAVVDGDTINCNFDYGFGLIDRDKTLRLAGINTPELHDKDPKVRAAALEAKGYLAQLAPVGSFLLVETLYDKREKYGRFFGYLYGMASASFPPVPSNSINQKLVDAGLAAPWDGDGSRPEPKPKVKVIREIRYGPRKRKGNDELP